MRLLEPLRIRDFSLLWVALTISLVGDGIYFVAIAWQVYELPDGAPRAPDQRRWLEATLAEARGAAGAADFAAAFEHGRTLAPEDLRELATDKQTSYAA